MIQHNFKLNNIIKFIKDYISIIVILPAFIGGLWQIIELANISMPFIRFFSISQIVPDGLLILCFFVIAFIPIIFAWYFDDMFYIKEMKTKNINEKNHNYTPNNTIELRNSAILFTFFYISSLVSFLYALSLKKDILDLSMSVIYSIVFIFFCNFSLNKCYVLSNGKWKAFFKFCNIFLLFLYIIIGIYFFKQIHRNFTLTNELDNLENVDKTLNIKYPFSSKEILYFNDKYIFFEITSSESKTNTSIKKIHIIELDKLFKED